MKQRDERLISERPRAAGADPAGRARVALSVFYALNLLMISFLAMYLASSDTSRQRTAQESIQVAVLITGETVALLLPALLLGIGLVAISPRFAQVVGGVGIVVVLPVFYVDFMVHRVFGLRLIAPKTWELVWPVLARAGDFTLQTSVFAILAPFGAFVVLEGSSCGFAWWVTYRTSTRFQSLAVRAVSAACVLVLASSIFRVITAPFPAAPFLPSDDPHPIHLTGLFDKFRPNVRPASALDQRCVAQLVASHANWDDVEQRYRNLEVSGTPHARPDVIVFVIESLRHDALTVAAAPNLSRLAEQSLVSQNHFSSGNGTHLGYFGILYGLNSLWYSRAVNNDVPPALPAMMGQMGYHRAFLGTWAIDRWKGMDRFLNGRHFDSFEILPLGKSYVDGDRATVDRAAKMLARDGEFSSLRDKPLFMVLQINTTHFEFHCEPEDEIFLPATSKLPPWDAPERQSAHNRYSNSVHCMDRLIAPLLDRQRVIIAVGDHGESLGEDGRYLHCSALTRAQLQTPFILYVPGMAPTRLDSPTSHMDMIPTLLDSLGVSVNDAAVLHGRSLQNPRFDHPSVPLVLGANDGFSWAVFDVAAKTEETWYHFTGHPFSAAFHLEGRAAPVDAAILPEPVDEEHFEALFQRMVDQLCGGLGPRLPEDACASLLENSQKRDNRIRLLALRKLAELGPAAVRAIPTLRRLLEDSDPLIRTAAAEALSAIKEFE